MDIAGAIGLQQEARTAEAYRPGHAAFVRRDDNPYDMLALVYCQGYEESSGILQLQWSKEASGLGGAPASGQVIKCHVVRKGVLYTLQGVVREISEGPMPIIRLKVPITCTALALRKAQRYSILGCLRLGDKVDPDAFSMKAFDLMNLSTGGFGVCIPPIAWSLNTEMPFSLKALAERNGAPIIELPSLELSGIAVLRQRSRVTPEGMIHAGCGFHRMHERTSEALECWISTYIHHLREV